MSVVQADFLFSTETCYISSNYSVFPASALALGFCMTIIPELTSDLADGLKSDIFCEAWCGQLLLV